MVSSLECTGQGVADSKDCKSAGDRQGCFKVISFRISCYEIQKG